MKNLMLDDNSSILEHLVKVLVYGKPGSGKTNFGASAPFPLILLSERQGLVHVRAAAKRLGRKLCGILFMETLDDYRNVLRALHGDKNKPFVVMNATNEVLFTSDVWPESVVLDSLTDACDRVIAEIREQSPQTTGKDGLPVDSERYWNVLQDRVTKLIRAFRDTPVHVVYLCQMADRDVGKDDNKVRVVGPQFPMHKLADVVAAAVNVVGVTYRKRGDKGADGDATYTYGIATVGPDYMLLKPYRPLRDFEVTDFASWVERIHGKDDGQAAPPPPEDEAPSTAAVGDVTAPTTTPQDAPKADAPATAAPAADTSTAQQAATSSKSEAKPEGKGEKASKKKPDPSQTIQDGTGVQPS